MLSKRGQTASNAAVLVALIALILLLYIIFIPPGEREDLLDGTNHTSSGSNNDYENITLLSESPGRLDFLKEDEFDHNIPAFTLFKTTSAQEVLTVNPFIVKNSWFDKKTRQVRFNIDDLENTDNVILSFEAPKHNGILVIKLNGQIVFENEIASMNIAPVSFQKSFLEEENILEFEVSDIGWVFWSSNTYSLQNIRILADVTDITRQESSNVFYLSKTEQSNLESAKLKFNPECRPSQVGNLDTLINGQSVFSGIPDCGILNILEFSPSILRSGTNKVIFTTDQGSYLIDRIKVQTTLKDLIYPTYYFTLDEDQFIDVQDDDLDVTLAFEFVRVNEDREMEVTINGRRFTVEIDEDETSLSRNIDSYTVEDENYIRIVPKTTLEIAKLKVNLG